MGGDQHADSAEVDELRMETVRWLLNNGAGPDVPSANPEWTPLMHAIQWRDLRMMTILIKAGADVNKIACVPKQPKYHKDWDTYAPEEDIMDCGSLPALYFACCLDKQSVYEPGAKIEDIVAILIASGADVNMQTGVSQNSALMAAAFKVI